MHEYELLYILHPRLTADEATGAIDRVSESITSRGGEVLSVDNWGRRRLAYPIAHQLEGTYVLATLRLAPEATAPLEAGLRISEDVIRHLLIRGIIPYEGPPTQEDRGRAQRPAPGEPESVAVERPAAETPAAAAEPAEPQPAEPQPPEAAADTASAGEASSDGGGGEEPAPQAEGERAAESAE